MLHTRRTHDRIVNTKPGCKTDCFAPRLRFSVVFLRLYSVTHEEIVDQETQPAGSQHGKGNKDLPQEADLVVLEDVDHAPDGKEDANNIDNFSNHNLLN